MSGEIDRASIVAWQTELRIAVFDAVKASDIREILRAQIEKAKNGDARAAEFVLRYCVGTPTVRVDQRVQVDRAAPSATGDGPGPEDPTPDQIRLAKVELAAQHIARKRAAR